MAMRLEQGFYWLDGKGEFLVSPDGDMYQLTVDLYPQDDAPFPLDPNNYRDLRLIKKVRREAIPMVVMPK